MLANPTFWVLVATVIFLAMAVKMGALKGLTGALDARGELVARELAEAAVLVGEMPCRERGSDVLPGPAVQGPAEAERPALNQRL